MGFFQSIAKALFGGRKKDEPAPKPITEPELDGGDWINKGVSLNELGHPSEALACYDRALAALPGNEASIFKDAQGFTHGKPANLIPRDHLEFAG